MCASLLLGLKPATRFEATVAAQNDEDWSRHSPVYHFSTFGAGIVFSILFSIRTFEMMLLQIPC